MAAVIVSWDDPTATRRAVESLLGQSVSLEEIVVVDNHPDHPAAAVLEGTARVIPSPNLGFAGGVAIGIRACSAPWVLLLNPDAVAAPDAVEHLLDAVGERTGLVGAQILLHDGRVNAGDNPVHLTGITWAGHFGEAPDTGPPRQAASVSGAAMLVRRDALDDVGGIAEAYFMYHEDVELSWRMRLGGWDVVFQPSATVIHDYEFDKGAAKWFLLERNRARTVLTCYSARALVLLAPLLIVTELAVTAWACRSGWWQEKRSALGATWRERRDIAARRHAVQARRVRPDADIVGLMTPAFDSPAIAVPRSRCADALFRAYHRVLLRALR